MIRFEKTRGLTTTLLAAIILGGASLQPVSAEDLMKGPTIQKTRSAYTEKPVSLPAWFGQGAIGLFSTIISPVDGPRSPSYPTGTAYGRDAIRQYGFLAGVILTADRLIHESDIHRGPIIIKHGVSRYYDPVRHNTFWWHSE